MMHWIRVQLHCLLHFHRVVTIELQNNDKLYCCWECDGKRLYEAINGHRTIDC